MRAAAANVEAFERLFTWLSPDRDEAARQYAAIRLRLIRFFESQGCPFAEDCADETIHRVAGKFGEGVEIQTGEPYLYFRGVARNVLFEQWRKRERSAPLDELPPQNIPAIHPAEGERQEEDRNQRERRLQCLERCLAQQPPENRRLFLDYHREGTGTKIDHRAAMAVELGIDATALRNRITRLRKKLETCVRNCLNGDTNRSF